MDNWKKRLCDHGYTNSWPPPTGARITYAWANDFAILGCGGATVSDNPDHDRVRPSNELKDLLGKKDGGKTVSAAFLSKLTAQQMELFWKLDHLEQVSKNTTQGEKDLLTEVFSDYDRKGKPFARFGGKIWTKVEFADQLIVRAVKDKFGTNSFEHDRAVQCAGDGDLWGRLARGTYAKPKMENLLKELCWIKDS